MRKTAWLAIAMAMACGDDTLPGDEGTTGDASTSTSTSTSPSTTSSPSTSGATDATDGSSSTGSDSDSGEPTSSESGEPTSEGSSSSSSGSEGSGSESSSSTGELACSVHGVLDSVPMLARAELVDDQNFEGSCSVAGSPEAIFTFTAPATGRYHFDVLTLHSVANAVLYVLDGECGGAQIDCDSADYWDGAYAAVVSVDMFEGDTITLVAESNYDNTQFEAVDEVEIAVMAEESCPAADLGSTVPQTISGSLAGVPNDYLLPCNDESSANDAGFLFTAPADGAYQFIAAESEDPDFKLPMFALADGCGGEAFACTSSWYSVDGLPLAVRMQAGETAAVFVTTGHDYSDVHFDLSVEEVEIPECPMADVPAALPASVPSSSITAGNDFASSCGGSFGDDAELTFTAPEDGRYVFAPISYEIYPVVSVLDGTCEGTELACVDPYAAGGEPGVAVELSAGQDVTVVVDDAIGLSGAFELFVDRFEGDCIDEDLGAIEPPFDVVGTTMGTTNSTYASCSGLIASDYGFAWTPMVAGDYTFSTAGSSYWSTISVRDASCDGAELDCERGYYYGNTGALVNVSLAAGQTVIIVVEGYESAAGDFVLHVEEQQPPGDCCDGAGTCSNPTILQCVCGNDEYCCDFYESSCVEIAIEGCDTECG
jgi:hypothetical protein